MTPGIRVEWLGNFVVPKCGKCGLEKSVETFTCG